VSYKIPGVAELADALDSKTNVSRLLNLTHRYSIKHRGYLARRTRMACAFSRLLILAHEEVIDKLTSWREMRLCIPLVLRSVYIIESQ